MQYRDLTTDQIISVVGDVGVPVSICIVGIILSVAIERLKRELEHTNFVIEQQFNVYQRIAKELNIIYQYCTYVGDWSIRKPEEIILLKREVDAIVFSSAPILNDIVIQAYGDFMAACFHVKSGVNTHIKIKANWKRFEESVNWHPEWREFFVEPASIQRSNGSYRRDVAQASYSKMMAAFALMIV